MKSPLFTIAIGILLLATACSQEREPRPENALVHEVASVELQSSMTLELLSQEGSMMTYGIVITNPEAVPVQSVRAWLRYDALAASVDRLTVLDERFSLLAPGENEVDEAEGFVKVGAASRIPVSDTRFVLASFRVQVRNADAKSFLSFYDWRPEGDGHTAVLSIQNESPVNIVQPPSSYPLHGA